MASGGEATQKGRIMSGAREIVAKLHPPPTCKFREELTEQLVPLNDIQVGIRNAVKNVEETKSEIAAKGGSMITSIKQSCQGLRDIVDTRERELLAETAAIVEQNTNRLDVQQKKLEMHSCTIQSLVEFVTNNIENSTDEELMSIHTQMMSRIRKETERQRQAGADLEPVEEADKEVLCDFAEDLEPVEIADRVVVVECADGMKKQCQENDSIIITSIVPLLVNITMENTEVVIGQRSRLVFQLTTYDGQPLKKLHSAKVVVTSMVDGSQEDTIVIHNHQNSYQIEFTPTVRGRHQLEVIYNDAPVSKEPVQIFVKIPPTQLGKPVRSIDVGKSVYAVAFNSSEELLVTTNEEILSFDKGGKKLYSITNEALASPNGLAVDRDNVYVTDDRNHCLLKFDKTGKLLKRVGQKGRGEGEFNTPFGITVVGDQVFVCDCLNNRLQAFTSDLVFVRKFGSQGSGNGQFICPYDITHDEEGNLYVTDGGNKRVQVFNTQGKFLRFLVNQSEITNPKGICISGELVYVSQWKENGQLFLYHKNGHSIRSHKFPCKSGAVGIWGIAIDQDGFIYACNVNKYEITIF